MNDDRARYQGMANQQAYLQGNVSPRDNAPELSEEIRSLLVAERDASVRRLRERATELELLSAEGYLKDVGLQVNDLTSFDLAGRMAKKGWSSLTYVNGSWRAYYAALSTETGVSARDIEAMLRGE